KIWEKNENSVATNADSDALSEWEVENKLPFSEVLKQIIKENFAWSKTANSYITPQPFTHNLGPNIQNTAETRFAFFYANFYATRQRSGNEDAFILTSAAEKKLFVVINILIGITVKASYKDYWSFKSELRNPLINSLMSRDIFS
ncbi:hypothetical protein ILUMI_14994, partial [Ignelater luminosus]